MQCSSVPGQARYAACLPACLPCFYPASPSPGSLSLWLTHPPSSGLCPHIFSLAPPRRFFTFVLIVYLVNVTFGATFRCEGSGRVQKG